MSCSLLPSSPPVITALTATPSEIVAVINVPGWDYLYTLAIDCDLDGWGYLNNGSWNQVFTPLDPLTVTKQAGPLVSRPPIPVGTSIKCRPLFLSFLFGGRLEGAWVEATVVG